MSFDDADRARLVALHPRLAPELPTIAERFYDVVTMHAETAALVTGPEHLARLRATLVEWMATGLLGPYDRAFHDRRSRIGRRHVEIGLPQHFMFTAMNVIRREYDARIARLYPPDEAWQVARSTDKLLDLELALMLRHYQSDSEERLLERERRDQADRLAAIQTLTAGLAHEIRNPLNSAKLQLDLLERRLRRDHIDPKLVEPAGVAHQEIERLTGMLNDFLAFARPPDPQFGKHDLVAIAQAVITGAREAAIARGAELALAAAGPIIAVVDAGKLEQILHNLVDNALEAVPTAGKVVVGIRADDANVYLEVADNGPGIPEEVRKRIYEPFFTTKEGGTGLGMSIVHSMVTLHGGTISLASSPHGARFEIVLPRGG